VAVDLLMFAASLAGYTYLFKRTEPARDAMFSIVRYSSKIKAF
jgi:hypothetical protein